MIYTKLNTKNFSKYKTILVDLTAQITQTNQPEVIIEERINQLYNYLLEEKAAVFLCLNEKEMPIAYIWYFYKDNNTIHINSFVVDKHYRGQGIGRNLLSMVYDIAKNNAINYVDLLVDWDNKDAFNIYINPQIVK